MHYIKIIFVIFFTFIFFLHTSQVSAANNKTEWLYVVKDNFVSNDKVLVIRTAPYYKNELWVVEYGVGCLSMWRYEDKSILATYSLFLDGVGGKIVLPNKYAAGSCRIWDAKKVNHITDEFRDEDWQWLSNNGYIK